MAITISGGVQLSGPVLLDPTGGSPSPAPSGGFQGSNYGYTSGGETPGGIENVIQKFSFSSDGDASDVGDLTVARQKVASQSSSVNGYASGGQYENASAAYVNNIDKFPFATDTNASDVGDLTVIRAWSAGQSSSTSGYTSGGMSPYTGGMNPYTNVIDKFPFSSDSNASDVGDLSSDIIAASGQSSSTNGYISGGKPYGSDATNIIEKFPFASDGNTTDVGDLAVPMMQLAGQSSSENGYVTGGLNSNPGPLSGESNRIQKFPFASDSNATHTADILSARRYLTGTSSTASGYASGGLPNFNLIEKFSFSSDSDSTDVGDLLNEYVLAGSEGQQY